MLCTVGTHNSIYASAPPRTIGILVILVSPCSTVVALSPLLTSKLTRATDLVTTPDTRDLTDEGHGEIAQDTWHASQEAVSPPPA